MDDQSLLRYSRHILLDEIGIEGQEKIRQSTVLVVGAGGLGCPAALYLSAAGVGELIIADDDTVDLTNLQRQILHNTERIGLPKVQSAKAGIAALNPDVQVTALKQRLQDEDLASQIDRADVVLDCSDNFETRHAVNRACFARGKPLVSGAAVRFDGQLAVFDPRNERSPCYHCLFPEGEEVTETRCATMGIFSPLTGIVGTLQAAEALKLLSGAGKTLTGQLLLISALQSTFQALTVPRDPACPVCATRRAHAPA